MSQCSGSIKDIKRASLILDDGDEDGEELGISVPTTCDKQSGESESTHVHARAHAHIYTHMKLIPKVKLAILHVSAQSVCLCVSGVIERWELLQAQCRGEQHTSSQRQQELTSDLDDITSWLEIVTPALDNQQKLEPVVSVEGMTAKAKELRVSVGAGRGTRDDASARTH